MFWPEEEGSGARSRRVEHSVPAGDKGEACQGPHSSELTHTMMHVKHTYTYTHIVIIISLSSLLSLFSFTIPFLPPLSSSFPLCHILRSDFHFFCVLYASYFFACLHISSVTPPCVTVQSVWEGYSQFRCKMSPKIPSPQWEMSRRHQQAQQFMHE